MSIIRIRLPKADFDKTDSPARTFVVKSDFSGTPNQLASDSEYANKVSNTIDWLKAEKAKKVVLSRIISYASQNTTAESIYNSFNEKFPNAAVFAFEDEQGANWIGATPELLFRKRGIQYQTLSLAGTRKAGELADWGAKEKEEQQLVTAFIQQELKNLGAREITVSELMTRNAGSIEHLCNDIFFQFEGDWRNVMDCLHPTPAICGLPRDEAKEIIGKMEDHDREYYSGLIGIERGEDVDVFVILRCLKMVDSKLNVYVGAGITTESVPELEARETRWKAESLTDVIF